MKKILNLILVSGIVSTSPAVSSPLHEAEIIRGSAGSGILAEDYGTFDEPWAMTFLPGGELLITEKSGKLNIFNPETNIRQNVSGVPAVSYGGQGGLGDIIIHPDFVHNQLVYLSYAEEGESGESGAAVARAKLIRGKTETSLEGLQVLWRQFPKVSGTGHYSHRLLIDGKGYLFITSGERQKQQPAQDLSQNLGKIIRLNDDGTVPDDNPFQNSGELAKTFWTTGHRNMLGIAIDRQGQLWAHEMGPRHGDEFNLIKKGENYGWPIVSWGNQYSGTDIPDHDTRPEFRQPETYWVPSIAPSGLIIYDGNLFESWHGDALIGGLVSKALIRVRIAGGSTFEIERFDMGNRIREVEQGPDGSIWILEDRSRARLRRLIPQ